MHTNLCSILTEKLTDTFLHLLYVWRYYSMWHLNSFFIYLIIFNFSILAFQWIYLTQTTSSTLTFYTPFKFPIALTFYPFHHSLEQKKTNVRKKNCTCIDPYYLSVPVHKPVPAEPTVPGTATHPSYLPTWCWPPPVGKENPPMPSLPLACVCKKREREKKK